MAKKEVWYRQCKFESDTGWDVFWIPEKQAKLGGRVYKEDDPEKTIYRITSVGDSRRNGTNLKVQQKAQRNYFKTTDI